MNKINRLYLLTPIIAALILVVFAVSGLEPSYALRPKQRHEAATGSAIGNQAFESLRNELKQSLRPSSLPDARMCCVMDYILGEADDSSDFVHRLTEEARNEYINMHLYLRDECPDLGDPVSIEQLHALDEDSIVVGFEVRTKNNRYILAVQIENTRSLDYRGLRTNLPDIEEGQSYRLNDVNTGVSFPLQPPYYPASFLVGETDRFGAGLDQDRLGAWEIKPKPGRNKGDFQLFRIDAEEPVISWEDLFVDPYLVPVDESHFERTAGNQRHYFARNETAGVACDIVTGPGTIERGSLLIVAFTNGNSGFGFFDRSAEHPYVVSDVQFVTRGEHGQRGVSFVFTSTSAHVSFGTHDIVLDTVRHIREWATSSRHEYQANGRAKTFAEFSDAVQNLPHEVMVELNKSGVSLGEMAMRNWLHKYHVSDGRGHHIYFVHRSMSGHIYLVDMFFPLHYKVEWSSEKGDVVISSGSSVEAVTCKVTVTMDFAPLELLSVHDIFTDEILHVAQSLPALMKRLQEVAFLATRSFFSAGSYRFLQYFSRDTIVWLQSYAGFLRPHVNEIVLQGVIDRILEDGELPSVEEIGDQVAYELVQSFCEACREARINNDYRSVKAIATALNNVPDSRLKYGVPDGNIMFLPVLADYMRREDISHEQKIAFLLHSGLQGDTNLLVILRNAEFVIKQAARYQRVAHPGELSYSGLISVADPLDIANWRDVTYGLGGGTIPSDVNAGWMPLALESVIIVLDVIENIDLSESDRQRFERVINECGGLNGLRGLLVLWEGVRSRINLELSPEEIRLRLSNYLSHGPVSIVEHNWLLDREMGAGVTVKDFLSGNVVPPIISSGASFFPVALSRSGDTDTEPVPVLASDSIIKLFDETMSPADILRVLTFMLPYPVGLWTPAGLLAASPVLSNDEHLWNQITKSAYGGCVVYGWQMEYFAQGLIRQIRRFEAESDGDANNGLLEILYSVLEACLSSNQPSVSSHELWTWDIDASGFYSVSFGSRPGHNDESNPVQLWSTSLSDIGISDIRNIAKTRALRLLKGGELLDAIAENRERYPSLPAVDILETLALPRVAVINHSIIGGGGVNIVALEHLKMLSQAGYPVTCIAGRLLNSEMAGEVFADITRTNSNFRFEIVPDVDVKTEVEADVRGHRLDVPYFERRVNELVESLDAAIGDSEVVIIHQAMSLATNLMATVALERLAIKYRGTKRFIAWIHNIDASASYLDWPMNELAKMCPDMEYVAVSPNERNRAAEMFGVDFYRIGVVNNSTSTRFAGITTQNALNFYLDNSLYDTDGFVWFIPSRMTETKCLEAAIYAADQANKSGIDIRLVIATPAIEGRFPDQGADGDYFRRLVEIKQSLGPDMSGKILFYSHSTGDMDEIADLYRLSDALIFPSQTETYGIPVAEAMINKKPVFIVDLPELRRLTADYAQVVIQPHDPSWSGLEGYGRHFGSEIVGFYNSNPGLRDIANAARRQIRHFSSEANIGVLSPYFNIPSLSTRAVRLGTRNFYGQSFETALLNAAHAGYSSFEINFEGFAPRDVLSQDYPQISSIIKSKRLEGFEVTMRLSDFSKRSGMPRQDMLREAAMFAMRFGITTVTVPVDSLGDETVSEIVDAAKWAQQEASKQGFAISDVLFSVENVSSEGVVFSSEELNRAFENMPVGLSVWLDTLPEQPLDYIGGIHMTVKTIYGSDAFIGSMDMKSQENRKHLTNKSAVFLRCLKDHGYRGDLIVQTPHLSLDQGRSLFDGLVRRAYMSEEAVESLDTGFITAIPSLRAARPVWDGATTANSLGLDLDITVTDTAKYVIVNNMNNSGKGILVIGGSQKNYLLNFTRQGFKHVFFAETLEEAQSKGYTGEDIILIVYAGGNAEAISKIKRVFSDIDIVQGDDVWIQDENLFWERLSSI